MPPFGIPPAYRESLVKLANLEEDDAARLAAAITELAAFAPLSSIEEATASVLGEEASPTERRLTIPLLALRGQLRQTSVSDIARQLSESPDLGLEGDARERLRSRAAAILEAPVIGTTGTATDLQTLNIRNYQGARIVTDLRPVFRDDVAETPDGAVIVETLHLQTWTRDGDTELLSVSMDEADLRQLRSAVERALEKTDTLKRFLAEKELSYFELEKESVEG